MVPLRADGSGTVPSRDEHRGGWGGAARRRGPSPSDGKVSDSPDGSSLEPIPAGHWRSGGGKAPRLEFPTCGRSSSRSSRRASRPSSCGAASCSSSLCVGLDFPWRARLLGRRLGFKPHYRRELTGHKTRAVFDRYDITSGRDLREAVGKLAAFYESAEPARKVISLSPG